MLKLVSNKIRCKFCGDIIESFSVHDFKRCHCGKCSTDGGLEYAQRSFFTDNPEDTYEDLSIYIDENGKLIKAQDADKTDIPLKPVRVEIKKVEVEKVPVIELKEDGSHEIKEVDAVPVLPEVIEAEAEPVPIEHGDTGFSNKEDAKKYYGLDDIPAAELKDGATPVEPIIKTTSGKKFGNKR